MSNLVHRVQLKVYEFFTTFMTQDVLAVLWMLRYVDQITVHLQTRPNRETEW